MTEYLNPKTDVVFQKLFGSEESKDILISLINSIVAPSFQIEHVTIKNPYNFADYAPSKSGVVDIEATDQTHAVHGIQLMVTRPMFKPQQAMRFMSKLFTEQVYQRVRIADFVRIVWIFLMDADEFEDDLYVRQLSFQRAESDEYDEALGRMKLCFVEMGKAARQPYDSTNSLDRWIKFLNEAKAFNENPPPAELISDPDIARALARFGPMFLNEGEREIYDAEQRKRMAQVGQLEFSRNANLRQGKEIGK